jgi:hypothetical protein
MDGYDNTEQPFMMLLALSVVSKEQKNRIWCRPSRRHSLLVLLAVLQSAVALVPACIEIFFVLYSKYFIIVAVILCLLF